MRRSPVLRMLPFQLYTPSGCGSAISAAVRMQNVYCYCRTWFMMNEVRQRACRQRSQSKARIIRNVETVRNLSLLHDYQAYLRVEKGLRPLTCEAYDSDLKTFAEFLDGRHGVLLTAAQEDVAAFLEHLREHGIDSRSSARKLSCLRGFYKWLLLDRRIHHDPDR